MERASFVTHLLCLWSKYTRVCALEALLRSVEVCCIHVFNPLKPASRGHFSFTSPFGAEAPVDMCEHLQPRINNAD